MNVRVVRLESVAPSDRVIVTLDPDQFGDFSISLPLTEAQHLGIGAIYALTFQRVLETEPILAITHPTNSHSFIESDHHDGCYDCGLRREHPVHCE